MDLSVIVLSWNTRELLLGCLASLQRVLEADFPGGTVETEVIVVDNGSRDGSPEAVREAWPALRVIALAENRGYAAGNNVGISQAKGRVLLLLNSDVALEAGALAEGLAGLEADPGIAAVGAQLLHPNGRLQNSIHAFPAAWHELVPRALLELALPRRFPSKRRPASHPIDVDAVLGAVLFVRREAIDRVGPLCEDYFFFLEETDWCWRMREAGMRVVHVPGARAVHRSGASSKKKHPLETRIEFHRSLYHFLRVRRGSLSAATARALRLVKSLLSLLPLGLAALFSVRARERLRSVWGLLVWHARGCPRGPGLRGLDPGLPTTQRGTLERATTGR